MHTRRLRPLRRGLPRVHRGDPLNSESEAACRPGYFGVTLRYSLSWGVPRTKRCVPCCAAGCPSAAHCGPALGWGGSAGCDECPPGIVKLETGLHRLNPNQGSTDDTYRTCQPLSRLRCATWEPWTGCLTCPANMSRYQINRAMADVVTPGYACAPDKVCEAAATLDQGCTSCAAPAFAGGDSRSNRTIDPLLGEDFPLYDRQVVDCATCASLGCAPGRCNSTVGCLDCPAGSFLERTVEGYSPNPPVYRCSPCSKLHCTAGACHARLGCAACPQNYLQQTYAVEGLPGSGRSGITRRTVCNAQCGPADYECSSHQAAANEACEAPFFFPATTTIELLGQRTWCILCWKLGCREGGTCGAGGCTSCPDGTVPMEIGTFLAFNYEGFLEAMPGAQRFTSCQALSALNCATWEPLTGCLTCPAGHFRYRRNIPGLTPGYGCWPEKACASTAAVDVFDATVADWTCSSCVAPAFDTGAEVESANVVESVGLPEYNDYYGEVESFNRLDFVELAPSGKICHRCGADGGQPCAAGRCTALAGCTACNASSGLPYRVPVRSEQVASDRFGEWRYSGQRYTRPPAARTYTCSDRKS